MRLFVCALFAAFLALASAAVVINGVCRDCTPPQAETLVVGDRVYKGQPGAGTVIINGQSGRGAGAGYSNRAAAGGGSAVPPGYSGQLGNSYVHNDDCVGCDVRG